MKELAEKADKSEKTIVNIERGEKVILDTLKAVAKAFHVECRVLIVGYKEPKIEPRESTALIKFRAKLDFDSFDEAFDLSEFIQKLGELIGATHDIIAISIERGSILFTLEMHNSDIEKFFILLSEDRGKAKLEAFGIDTESIGECAQYNSYWSTDGSRNLIEACRNIYDTYYARGKIRGFAAGRYNSWQGEPGKLDFGLYRLSRLNFPAGNRLFYIDRILNYSKPIFFKTQVDIEVAGEEGEATAELVITFNLMLREWLPARSDFSLHGGLALKANARLPMEEMAEKKDEIVDDRSLAAAMFDRLAESVNFEIDEFYSEDITDPERAYAQLPHEVLVETKKVAMLIMIKSLI